MRKGVALIAVLMPVMLVSSRCNEAKTNQPSSADNAPRLPPGDPQEYFPYAPGTEWVYQITTSQTEPLEYRELEWPLDTWVVYAERDRFPGLISNPSARGFLLKIKVERPAAQQGRLRYPDGVELAIETDDLGVFENCDHVFWAIDRANKFSVFEVATYPPSSPEARRDLGSRDTSGQQDGYFQRPFFIFNYPGSSMGRLTGSGEQTNETLTFVGAESYQGTQFLHFQWEVTSSTPPPGVPPGADADYLNSAITEDAWFGRGEGLARLEQKVAGTTSMVWSLSQFSTGR